MALDEDAWFSLLPKNVQSAVLEAAHIRRLVKGQQLFAKGDQPDGWYCVASGSVKISSTTLAGREVSLTYMPPGSWFGEISLFDGKPRTHDARAQTKIRLLVVPTLRFQQLLLGHPELAVALTRLQCERIRALFELVEELRTQSLEQRLARRLLALGQEHGRPETAGTLIQLKLPQDQLAHLLTATRQSVNKIFKSWERAGYVSQRYGQIVLIDFPALQGLAEAGI